MSDTPYWYSTSREQHVDDAAIDRFAAAMKVKMAKQRAKGYGGWDAPKTCPTERLQTMLTDHIGKGDPVDVGNFAMMLFSRGEKTAPPPRKPEQETVSKAAYNRVRDEYNDLIKASKRDAIDAAEWRKHVLRCQMQGVDLDHNFGAPPPRQPLTDEQNAKRWRWAFIESPDWTYAVCKWDGKDWLPIKTEDDIKELDQAIEAAHGIGKGEA